MLLQLYAMVHGASYGKVAKAARGHGIPHMRNESSLQN